MESVICLDTMALKPERHVQLLNKSAKQQSKRFKISKFYEDKS